MGRFAESISCSTSFDKKSSAQGIIMQTKIVLAFAAVALVACASAYPQGYGGGYDGGYNGGHDDYHHAPSPYKFDYAVHDAHTGDIKNQWEHSDGGVVKGEYSLVEADGTTRTVSYTADDKNGFNAVVKKSGHAHHPQHYVQHKY